MSDIEGKHIIGSPGKGKMLYLEHAGILTQDRDIETYKFQYFGPGDPTPEEIENAVDQQLIGNWIFQDFYIHSDGLRYIQLHKVPDISEIS